MASELSSEDCEKIREVLVDLLVRSEADDCLVCDSGGYVLVQGQTSGADPFLISALGAGVFAASRELARSLGEDEFSAVFHQGEKRSIFIRAVNLDVLLVNIFSSHASVGLVKLYSASAASELRMILEDIRKRAHVDTGDHRQFVLSDNSDIFHSRRHSHPVAE